MAWSCRKKKECATGAGTQIVGGVALAAPTLDEYGRKSVGLMISNGLSCSGVIASEGAVLTARHCVQDGLPLQVIFGPSFAAPQTRATVSNYFKHPTDDAAVVTFSGGLPRGFFAAHLAETGTTLGAGESVVLTGYGRTSTQTRSDLRLRRVSVDFVESKADPERPWATLPFLWLDARNGKGACVGDSGGPAFVKRNGKVLVVGLTQGGDGLCGSEYVRYSDVRLLRSWMLTHFTPSEDAYEPEGYAPSGSADATVGKDGFVAHGTTEAGTTKVTPTSAVADTSAHCQ